MPSLFQILLKRMAELSANAVKLSDIPSEYLSRLIIEMT